MSNDLRGLYREAFAPVTSSDDLTMEEIMNKRRPHRGNRRFVVVCACILVLLLGTISVDAASGGKVGEYFDTLFAKNQMELTYQDEQGNDCSIALNLEADATVGIYDADNNLVRNLTNEEVKSVDFTKDTQKCTIDGNEYRVCVLMTINSAGDTVSNQIRLYAPADYAKGVESINKDTTPAKSDEEGLVVVSPYVDVE